MTGPVNLSDLVRRKPGRSRRPQTGLRFADVFAGLGGFHVGLSRLGHTCVFASEIDEALCDVYRRNFGIAPVGDIRSVPLAAIPEHDILCAGFPCQPFSKAGDQVGFACSKYGDLFGEILRLLKGKAPTFFLLENVPNLLRHDHGRTWRDMAAALEGLGYSVSTSVISPHHLGVPQIRDRLFIVGSRDGLGHLKWPARGRAKLAIRSILDEAPAEARPIPAQHNMALDLWQEFLDRLPSDVELSGFPIWSAEFEATYPFEGVAPLTLGRTRLSRYRGAHGRPLQGLDRSGIEDALPPYARSAESRFPAWKERFIRLNRKLYWRHRDRLHDWVDKIREFPPSLQKFEWHCRGEDRVLRNFVIQFRSSGIRVRRDDAAPALVALNSSQVPVLGWEARYMTVRECARIQGLDGLRQLPAAERGYRALGNAVNADIVSRIAEALIPFGVTRTSRSAKSPSANGSGSNEGRRDVRTAMPTNDEGTVGTNKVSIRPGVSVLSVLRHLNYQPWYALAEFVDNAVQSFLHNRRELQRIHGKKVSLAIDIEFDPDNSTITVRDNAAGIHERDYDRAFRTAEVPPDRTGLSEFGMGMKSAACWFAPRWSVRTKALGEKLEKTISFDISKIVKDSLEELEFKASPAPIKSHHTEIVLAGVYRMPQTKTLGKIKAHLASMYRMFIRQGLVTIRVNGEDPLDYEEPAILRAPHHKTPKGKAVEWRKAIDVQLGGGRRAHGFAALREVGSTSAAGFALFRRGRLIQGSADDGYRPEYIFGKSNSYVYQRLFGELTLEGFDVAHTKDGFRWDEAEDDLLELLRKQLEAAPIPLLTQAKEYRAKPSRNDLQAASEVVLEKTANAVAEEGAGALDDVEDLGREDSPPAKFAKGATLSKRVISVERDGTEWEIALETTDDDGVAHWIDVFQHDPKKGVRRLGVRVSLAHPFTVRFAGTDKEVLEPLMRLAAALGMAEATARDAGVRNAGTIRLHLNELLRESFTRA